MTKKPIVIKNIAKINKELNHTKTDDIVDKWVNKHEESKETKEFDHDKETRFTIMIPTYLHRRIKKHCAGKSISMKRKLIEIFKENFPEI